LVQVEPVELVLTEPMEAIAYLDLAQQLVVEPELATMPTVHPVDPVAERELAAELFLVAQLHPVKVTRAVAQFRQPLELAAAAVVRVAPEHPLAALTQERADHR
jgi:hypothetical protein